jgi:methionyl-tRNA formyltransferase
VQWAILNGDETTGISIMTMEAGLDSGPVLHQIETEIPSDETGGELTERLAELGAEALIEALTLLASDASRPQPQDHSRATYASKITHESCRLDWSRDAAQLARAIRAFDPAPGAWARFDGEEVKLFGAAITQGSGPEGTILAVGRSLTVAGGVGAMEVQEVQPAGRRRMSAAAWARGRPGGREVEGRRFE